MCLAHALSPCKEGQDNVCGKMMTTPRLCTSHAPGILQFDVHVGCLLVTSEQPFLQPGPHQQEVTSSKGDHIPFRMVYATDHSGSSLGYSTAPRGKLGKGSRHEAALPSDTSCISATITKSVLLPELIA